MQGPVYIGPRLQLVYSRGRASDEFLMFVVEYLRTEHLSIYILEQAGLVSWVWALRLVDCFVISVLKPLILFFFFFFLMRILNQMRMFD